MQMDNLVGKYIVPVRSFPGFFSERFLLTEIISHKITLRIWKGIRLYSKKMIRYVIPKGEAEDEYTEEEIIRLMNHINSYSRKKWNRQSPVDLFIKFYS